MGTVRTSSITTLENTEAEGLLIFFRSMWKRGKAESDWLKTDY